MEGFYLQDGRFHHLQAEDAANSQPHSPAVSEGSWWPSRQRSPTSAASFTASAATDAAESFVSAEEASHMSLGDETYEAQDWVILDGGVQYWKPDVKKPQANSSQSHSSMAQAKAKSPRAKAKAKAKPKTKGKAKPKAVSKAKAKPKTKAKAKTKAKPKPVSKAKAKPKAKCTEPKEDEPKAEGDAQAQHATEAAQRVRTECKRGIKNADAVIMSAYGSSNASTGRFDIQGKCTFADGSIKIGILGLLRKNLLEKRCGRLC